MSGTHKRPVVTSFSASLAAASGAPSPHPQCSAQKHVCHFACDVQGLVLVRVRPVFALGEVDAPVKHELGKREPRAARHDPDRSGVDQCVGGHVVPPHRDRLLSGRDAVWRIVAIFAFRGRVALQRIVGQSVADEEFEEEFHVLFAVEVEG